MTNVINFIGNFVYNPNLKNGGLFNTGKPTIEFTRMFSTDSAKAIKASKFGYFNGINYMAPAKFAADWLDAKFGTVCANSTPACEAICLGTESGQAAIRKEGGTNKCIDSRIRKTRYFFEKNGQYMVELVWHIVKLIDEAKRHDLTPVVRLNGASDLPYERMKIAQFGNRTIFQIFPDIQFIDYTKRLDRLENRRKPGNLHLTFSLAENNDADAEKAALMGFNVAAIFADHLPEFYFINGRKFRVINGDTHDIRSLDPAEKIGVIVGLLPKGRKAKKDEMGMVRRDHHDFPQLQLAA